MHQNILINGTKLAQKIRSQVHQEIVAKKLEPQLAVVLVGEDPASHIYVGLKEKACREAGIGFHKYLIDSKIKIADLLETIDFLNKDPAVDAILVQLPLPNGLDENLVIAEIDPSKDVDGFHP